MLPGPRPTLGPLPSFLLQLSPTHVSLRILAGFPPRKGTRLSVSIPWELQAPRGQAALPLTMGLALSSDVKFCSSVPGFWQAPGHLL